MERRWLVDVLVEGPGICEDEQSLNARLENIIDKGIGAMDITYTSEFDANRYGRLVEKTLALAGNGIATSRVWCLMVAGFLMAFSLWLKGCHSPSAYFTCVFLVWLPWLFRWILRRQVRQYVKTVDRLLGGERISQVHMTDEEYEATCGAMSQKMPWKNLGTNFHFFDNNTVVLIQPNGMPTLVLDNLSSRNVDCGELESALRRVGMKPVRESKRRKVRMIVNSVFCVAFSAIVASNVVYSVLSCRYELRFQDTQMQLFDLIHGKNDPRHPLPSGSLRAKVVRLLMHAGKPDEFLYVFAPEEEFEKVGLFARYDDWCCEAYYPCGCVCSRDLDYFNRVKELHKATIYFESEKDKWLEKIRPIANDLYQPVCDDCECDE